MCVVLDGNTHQHHQHGEDDFSSARPKSRVTVQVSVVLIHLVELRRAARAGM